MDSDAFGMRFGVGDLVDGETAGFPDAKAGVVDEPDQKVIPSPEGAAEIDA